MGDIWGFKTLMKAKNADEYIFTKESYVKSPNLFATSDFKEQTQLSDTNLNKPNITGEQMNLLTGQHQKGYQSTGVLFKPENFDPNKKYPMIVYFYEKLSENLNRYVAPAPTPSRLNISYFVSNGYLVFTPDISYNEDGHPGRLLWNISIPSRVPKEKSLGRWKPHRNTRPKLGWLSGNSSYYAKPICMLLHGLVLQWPI